MALQAQETVFLGQLGLLQIHSIATRQLYLGFFALMALRREAFGGGERQAVQSRSTRPEGLENKRGEQLDAILP